MSLCFLWSDVSYWSHKFPLISFGLYLWKINSIVSVPACFPKPRDRWPSLLHIELAHTGSSILTGSMYPNILLVVLQLTWFDIDSIVMYIFGFSQLLGSHGAALLVYPLLFSQFSFLAILLFLGVTTEFLLSWFLLFFLGEPVGFTLGMTSQQAPSEVLNWWMDLIGMHFYLDLFLVHLCITPWLAPSEVLLGRLIFQISPLRISMITCVHLLVLIVGLLVLDYVVHKLNPVRHELCICRGHFWHVELFGGKLYCVWYSSRSCFGDLCLMVYLVFHWWYNLSSSLFMCFLLCSIVWPILNYYSCPRWG